MCAHHSTAHSLAVICMISPVLRVKPFHTATTVTLTCSALSNTRFAKWRCFRTENSVSTASGAWFLSRCSRRHAVPPACCQEAATSSAHSRRVALVRGHGMEGDPGHARRPALAEDRPVRPPAVIRRPAWGALTVADERERATVARAASAVRSLSRRERGPPESGRRHRVDSVRSLWDYGKRQHRLAGKGKGERMQGFGVMHPSIHGLMSRKGQEDCVSRAGTSLRQSCFLRLSGNAPDLP